MENNKHSQSISKSVYLITTKKSGNKIFNANLLKSSFKTSESFLDLLLMDGGFVNYLWTSFANEDLKNYIQCESKNKPIKNINTWWDYENKSQLNDYALIVDSYLASKTGVPFKEKEILSKLLTGFIRIETEEAILLITHNWYVSGVCENPNFQSDSRFKFIEKLIDIAAAIENVDHTSIKLFLHDRDLINAEKGVDAPLTEAFLLDHKELPAKLTLAIKDGRVRLFMHDSLIANPSFYASVLNLNSPISKSTLDSYFGNRIPPKISIQNGYIEIDITESDSNKQYCSITEIIDAIISYQLNRKFKLNAIVESDNFKLIEEIEDELPFIIIGDYELMDLIDKDGRALYLDNSIWIRYAKKGDKNAIENALDTFKECHNNKIYKTSNAKEVKEFKARLSLNSYLKPFGGGHHGDIVPFVFHSEMEMKDLADGISYKINGIKTRIRNVLKADKLTWRVLVIDDNAFINDQANEKSVNKCKVISSILNRDFTVLCDNHFDLIRTECTCSKKGDKCPYLIDCTDLKCENDLYPNIYLDCARTIEEAKEKIKTRRYDIVLLDYLLGDKDNHTSRDYGTDILREFKKQYEDYANGVWALSEKDGVELKQYQQAKGPFGKFWIFFISAFSNAISEKMLSKGMHYNTDYWHIARGACPTTTPELFRYNLISLMLHQLNHISEIEEWESKDNKKQKVITLIDYLTYLFDDLGDVRIRAIDNFNSLLHLRSRYDRLKRDYYMGGKEKGEEAKENGSPLVQALFPDMDCYSNAYWEHIQHLIYLIAYGNILQWNEMWDEYIFVKENLKRAEKVTGTTGICKQIEAYIIGIKSANFK